MKSTEYNQFIEQFILKYSEGLPGINEQLKMAPQHRKPAADYLKEAKEYKVAAVLALLVPSTKDDYPGIVLIERASGQDVHASQISFPGGKQEEGEDVQQTALRETEEEIGVPSHAIKLVGPATSLFIPPSNFLVHPFIGYTDSLPEFTISESEVKRVIVPSLSVFLDERNTMNGKFSSARGYEVTSPYYKIDDVLIWGATAMMLSEIVSLLRKLT